MDINRLNNLLSSGNGKDIRTAFIAEHNSRFNPIDYLNYDPHTHRIIRDRLWRPDRIIYRDIPNEYDTQGKPMKDFKVVPVTRLAVPWQREIIETVATFAVGGDISLISKPSNDNESAFQQDVINLWKLNKMQFVMRQIAERVFSETECATIMYSTRDDDDDPTVRINVVSPAQGDILYPIFDGKGQMIAFGWEYVSTNYKFNFDIYSKDTLYKYMDKNSGLQLVKTITLPYGRIPVVYFNQYESEWRKVQHLIERFETTLSNLCDTNDYNGSPILFTSGEIQGFSEKGEQGKVITGLNGAEMKYVTWDNASESVKLELDTLQSQIYTKTKTVDLSPNALKGIGSAPSGVAFDRMLILPHMKGIEKQTDTLGLGAQRLVNLFKAALYNLLTPTYKPARKLIIEPVFSLFRIDSVNDRIQTMAIAMPGKQLTSLKTAVGYINLTQNTDDEVTEIESEEQKNIPFNGNGGL